MQINGVWRGQDEVCVPLSFLCLVKTIYLFARGEKATNERSESVRKTKAPNDIESNEADVRYATLY